MDKVSKKQFICAQIERRSDTMLQEIQDAVKANKLFEWVIDNYFMMDEEQKRRLMIEITFMIDFIGNFPDFTGDIQGLLNKNLGVWDETFK